MKTEPKKKAKWTPPRSLPKRALLVPWTPPEPFSASAGRSVGVGQDEPWNPDDTWNVPKYDQPADLSILDQDAQTKMQAQAPSDRYYAEPDRPDKGGPIQPGNIDLNNRPQVDNGDGSYSTVRSMSFGDDSGAETLVPTVGPRGQNWDQRQAIDNYDQTGQHLGRFRNPDDATAYAQQLHQSQAQQYAPNPDQSSGLSQTPQTSETPTFPDQSYGPPAPADRGWPGQVSDEVQRRLQAPPGQMARETFESTPGGKMITLDRQAREAEAAGDADQAEELRNRSWDELQNVAVMGTMEGPRGEVPKVPPEVAGSFELSPGAGLSDAEQARAAVPSPERSPEQVAADAAAFDDWSNRPPDMGQEVQTIGGGTRTIPAQNQPVVEPWSSAPQEGQPWRSSPPAEAGEMPWEPPAAARPEAPASAPLAPPEPGSPLTREEVEQAIRARSAQGPVPPSAANPPEPPAPPAGPLLPPEGEFPTSGGMGNTEGMRSPQEAQSLVNQLADAKENVFGTQPWGQQRAGALALGLDPDHVQGLLEQRAGPMGVEFARQEPQNIRLLKNTMAAAKEETENLYVTLSQQQQRAAQGVGMGVKPPSVVDAVSMTQSLYELAKARLQASSEAFGASRTAAGRTLQALQDRVNTAAGQMILDAHDILTRTTKQTADRLGNVRRNGGISEADLNAVRRAADAIDQHADILDTNNAADAVQRVQKGRGRVQRQGAGGQPPTGGSQGPVRPSGLPEEPSLAEQFGQLEREEFQAHARPEGQGMGPGEQAMLDSIQSRKSALLDQIQAEAEERALAMEPARPGDPLAAEEIQRLVNLRLGAPTVASARQKALEAAGMKRPVDMVTAIVNGIRTGERQVVKDDAAVARYWADNAVKFPDEPGYRTAFQASIDNLRRHSPRGVERADQLVQQLSDRLRKQEADLIRTSIQRNTKQVTGDMAASEKNFETLQAAEVSQHLKEFYKLARDNPRDPMLADFAERVREELMMLGQKSQEKAASMRRQMVSSNVEGWMSKSARSNKQDVSAAVDALMAINTQKLTQEEFQRQVGQMVRAFADPMTKVEGFNLLRRNALTSGLGTMARVAVHSSTSLIMKTLIDPAASGMKVLAGRQTLGQAARELNVEAAGAWYGLSLGSQTFWDLTSQRGLLGMLSRDGVKAMPAIAREYWAAAGQRMMDMPTQSMLEQGLMPRSSARRIFTGTQAGASLGERAMGTVQRGVAHSLEMPSRAHTVLSDMAGMSGQYAQMARRAAQRVHKSGLEGDAAMSRIQHLMQFPDDVMVREASQVGKRMSQRRDYGYAGHAMEGAARRAPLLVNIIEPFRRIAYSTGASAVEKSPVGLAGTLLDVARGVYDPKGAGGSALEMGRYRRSFSAENLSGELGDPRSGVTPLGERLAMNTVGSLGFIWAVNKAFGGEAGHEIITGDGPSDPEMRRQLTQNFGWQPHSILIGGQYVSYASWGSLAFMLSAAAAYPDQLRYEKVGTDPLMAAGMAALKAPKVIGDQSIVRGIASIIQAEQDPQRYGPSWLGDFMGGLFPMGAIAGQVTNALTSGPNARRSRPISEVGLPEHLRQQLAAKGLPGMGGPGSVPIDQDQLGRPIPNPKMGFQAFAPFTTTQARNDPLVQAYTNLGIRIGQPQDTISAGTGTEVKLSTEQKMVAQQAFGKVLSAMWEKAPEANRNDPNYLHQMLEKARSAASGAVLAAMSPEELAKSLSFKIGTPADKSSQDRAVQMMTDFRDPGAYPKYAADLGKALPQVVWKGLENAQNQPAMPGPKPPGVKAADAAAGIADAQKLIAMHADPRFDDWNRWFGTFKGMDQQTYLDATSKSHPRYLVPGWGEPQYKMADYVLQLYRDLPAGLPPTTAAGALRASLAPAAATLRKVAMPSWRMQLGLDGADFADLATQQVQNPNDIFTGLPATIR